MMRVKDVVQWLTEELLPEQGIGVDEGGLRLVTQDGQDWLEIGGIPEEDGPELPQDPTGVDCAWLYVREGQPGHPKKIGWVRLVYGNGEDVISDYTNHPGLHAVVEAAQDVVENAPVVFRL